MLGALIDQDQRRKREFRDGNLYCLAQVGNLNRPTLIFTGVDEWGL